MTPSLSDSDRTRFHSKVERSDADACWPWLAGRSKGGYGVFHPRGMARTFQSTWLAVLIARDEWPAPGQIVLHRCDNPPCCNPRHLSIGTRYANALDMIHKGRCGTNRLTADSVATIRRRLMSGETGAAIARDFDVNAATVSLIKTGRIWRHVEPAPVGVALHTTNIITAPSDRTAFDCVASRTLNAGGAK